MIDASALVDLIHREIERKLAERHPRMIGLVTSYDPQNHSAKVQLKPDDIETGWLPIATQHIGNGWGIVSGLQINDQVEVEFQEGDFDVGRVTGRVHSDQDKPPQVQSGELLMQHTSGTKVFMDQTGQLTVSQGNGGGMLQLKADGSAIVMPKAGKLIYLGGDGVTGTHDFVQTASGTSTVVKAKL